MIRIVRLAALAGALCGMAVLLPESSRPTTNRNRSRK